jgi:hypothetical protein
MDWLWKSKGVRRITEPLIGILQGLIEGISRSPEGEKVLRAVLPFRAYGFRELEVIPVGADIESVNWIEVERYVNRKLSMLRVELVVRMNEPIEDSKLSTFLIGPIASHREDRKCDDASMVTSGHVDEHLGGWSHHRMRVGRW